MPFDNAWALGRWDEGDRVLDVWKTAAQDHLMEAESSEDFAQVFRELSCRSLVLLSFGLGVADKTFDNLRETGSQVIVYVPPGRGIGPRKAVQLCSGGVLGFFAASDGLPDSLRSRLLRLYGGKPMFRKIELSSLHLERKPESAFLASPYAPPIGTEFLDSAEAALERRGIRVKDPRAVHRGGTVGQKVDDLIKEADFVVANMRLTDKGFNPNVWMEIGFARGLGKPVIPYRYVDDRKPVASDLQGTDYLVYHDGLDLAMQLYWGLEWLGTPE